MQPAEQQHFAEAPAAEDRLRTSSPTQSPSRYVPSLHLGPKLRKLLGKSTDTIWLRLQRRARRMSKGENTITISIPELARIERIAPRTVEFALHRLEEAGIIRRQRGRHETRVEVLCYDLDEHDVREWSPYVPVETTQWMREKRPAGRPKSLGKPARKAMSSAAAASPDEKARILAHPSVPTSPFVPALAIPNTPTPRLLLPDMRQSEKQEFLIEAYASCVRLFFPNAQVQTACKWMRSRAGNKVLAGAIDACIALDLSPQAWCGVQFERAVRQKRKQPPRAEVVWEPSLIEEHGAGIEKAIADLGMNIYRKQPVHQPEYAVFVRGVHDLRKLYQQTIFDLGKLERYDELAIARIVNHTWPDGYRETYKRAEQKLRTIQNEVDQRVLRGTYVWSPANG